jgi:hypothetical protein
MTSSGPLSLSSRISLYSGTNSSPAQLLTTRAPKRIISALAILSRKEDKRNNQLVLEGNKVPQFALADGQPDHYDLADSAIALAILDV